MEHTSPAWAATCSSFLPASRSHMVSCMSPEPVMIFLSVHWRALRLRTRLPCKYRQLTFNETASGQEALVAGELARHLGRAGAVAVVHVVHGAHVVHAAASCWRINATDWPLFTPLSGLPTKLPDGANTEHMTHADLSGITCTLLPVHVSQMMSLPSSEPETRCLSRKRADVTSERSEHRFFSLVPSNPLCHLPHYRTGHSSGFRSKPFLHGLPHKLPRIARVVGGRDFVDVPLQHATALGLASLRLFDAGRGRLERRVAALFRLRLRRMHVQTKLDCCYILLRYLALFNEVLKLLLEGGGLGVVLGRHFHGRTREHGRRTRHKTTRRRDADGQGRTPIDGLDSPAAGDRCRRAAKRANRVRAARVRNPIVRCDTFT